VDQDTKDFDRQLMMKCIALAKASGEAGEYPYGAIIAQGNRIIAQSINRVRQDGDVTRHAEVVTISLAQKALGTVSLDDCTIYVNAEPCAFCCYAIREARISRVVFGLHSPHMGGLSKWNVLGDDDLSHAMPEIFAPPPEILSGFMAKEAQQALFEWNYLAARYIRDRGLFDVAPVPTGKRIEVKSPNNHKRLLDRIRSLLRRAVFDRFGRR
jgi:tRNA(adenine34) deaminase